MRRFRENERDSFSYGAAAEILANSSESFETLVLRLIIDVRGRLTRKEIVIDYRMMKGRLD